MSDSEPEVFTDDEVTPTTPTSAPPLISSDDQIPTAAATPTFSRRKTTAEFDKEKSEYTVLQLSKLLANLSPKVKAYDTTSTLAKRIGVALLTFSTLMIMFLCRPYCPTPSTSYWSIARWNPFPCRPCPYGAECGLFNVQRCVDENVGLKDGFICVPRGATGENAYELSKLAKSILDRQAFAYNCVGSADTKTISEEDLRDAMEDHIEKVIHTGTTFTHAFDTMKELLKNNTEAYHLFVQESRSGASFASTRFDSGLSCILAPHLFWENMRGTLLSSLKKRTISISPLPEGTKVPTVLNPPAEQPTTMVEEKEEASLTPQAPAERASPQSTATDQQVPATTETETTTASTESSAASTTDQTSAEPVNQNQL